MTKPDMTQDEIDRSSFELFKKAYDARNARDPIKELIIRREMISFDVGKMACVPWKR
jgi:hypothetical protein